MVSADNSSRNRPSLKLNALSNFAGLAVSVAVGFFLTPAMLSYLGEKRFGMWTLVSSLVGYYGLLDFGVSAAVLRYVPLFHGQGNHHRVSAVVSTSLGFYSALSLVVIVLTQIVAQPISHFFGGGPELAGLLRIIGVAAALSLPAIVLNTTTASYESFAPANVVGASTQLLRGALLVGCIWAHYGLVAMGWAVLLSNLFSLVGNSVVFKHACKDVQLSIKSFKWTELKMLLSFGSVILIVTTANSLATESPKQVVAKTISLEALGLFGISLLLISYYRMLIISLTKVFSPRFSFLSGRQDEGGIRRLFIQGCRYTTMIAGAVAVLFWVTGPPFLLLWTGKPEIVKAVPALTIMVAGTFVFLSHRLGGDLLFGLGRQGQVALLELTEALGIVGLTIILSLKFGLAGAALGLAIPPVIIRGLLQTRFVCQALKLTVLQYYSKCVLRSWLVVAVIPILAHVLSLRQLVTGWPSQVLVSALVLALYGLSVFAVVLEPAERRQLRRDSRRFLNVVGFLRAA
jgi:O-antigen/teichoic acid export membrane protein